MGKVLKIEIDGLCFEKNMDELNFVMGFAFVEVGKEDVSKILSNMILENCERHNYINKKVIVYRGAIDYNGNVVLPFKKIESNLEVHVDGSISIDDQQIAKPKETKKIEENDVCEECQKFGKRLIFINNKKNK